MQKLAESYPKALKIRVVQDNLNTHTPNAFYACLPADEAAALAARFEFYYTPKCGSWLNMIEIEFSALSRQCLNRRIPTAPAARSGPVGKRGVGMGGQPESSWCEDQVAVHCGAVSGDVEQAVCESEPSKQKI
jgi:DDE superfamily endonuclease